MKLSWCFFHIIEHFTTTSAILLLSEQKELSVKQFQLIILLFHYFLQLVLPLPPTITEVSPDTSFIYFMWQVHENDYVDLFQLSNTYTIRGCPGLTGNATNTLGSSSRAYNLTGVEENSKFTLADQHSVSIWSSMRNRPSAHMKEAFRTTLWTQPTGGHWWL